MELINLFVSYSHRDSAFADKLCSAMESVRIPHFRDAQIEFGQDWTRKIEDALKRSTHLICLMSQAGVQSPWVQEELRLARQLNKKIVPILLERSIPLTPLLDPHLQYVQADTPNLSSEDLLERLIWAGVFDAGIIPVGLFRWYKRRFPNEFFASELLTQPLFLLRNDRGKVIVRVNRAQVEYVVTSNIGKRHLCERYVKPQREKWIDLDRKILDFMRDPARRESLEIRTADLPLRWASGGVLSIVNWKGSKWVPFFFRDIPPYGWNISLGATERYFDDNEHEINDGDHSLRYELCSPWKFIVREFLEETLILDNCPNAGVGRQQRRFSFAPNLQIRVSQQQADAFARDHLDLRQNQDGLNIQVSPEGIPVATCDDTTTNVSVVGSGADGEGVWDVLVAINPLELGIEVIKVFEYALADSDCILDGEVYQIGSHHQMVRMPIGLISLRYLYESFGAADYQLHFNEETVLPGVNSPPFGADDIHVYRWDIDRRATLWGDTSANDWEKERFSDWRRQFGQAFDAGLAGNASLYPHLFTPASAKALNLFFNCCGRGQALANEYRLGKPGTRPI